LPPVVLPEGSHPPLAPEVYSGGQKRIESPRRAVIIEKVLIQQIKLGNRHGC